VKPSMRARWKGLFKADKSVPLSASGSSSSNPAGNGGALVSLPNPVTNYYQHKLRTNLDSLLRFALRSRSLVVRDVFAKGVSEANHDLTDLLTIIENKMSKTETDFADFRDIFDSSVLLALAGLLADTARNDWDNYAALAVYGFALNIYGLDVFEKKHKLRFVEALVEGHEYEQFHQVKKAIDLDAAMQLQMDLLEIQAVRRCGLENDWLTAMNQFYSKVGLSKVRLSDDRNLPLLDRLESDILESYNGPKISVIIPTFSPGPGIRTAVRSLLQQTWNNIEIIIVDDASPEMYSGIFEELKAEDSRIRLIRHAKNSGAYVARNSGLKVANGEFITIHDDDDWSHPDKLARQVNPLLEDASIVASSSAHIRTSEALYFKRINTQPVFMQMNYSSIMVRRSLIDEIGAWDTVNRGADGEFLLRVITNFSSNRIVDLKELPLSFSRIWSGSLTSGEMSRGYFAPSRLLYREAFRQWHRETKRDGSTVVLEPGKARNFPVPTTFEPGKSRAYVGSFDIVFVTDFYRQAKYVDIVMSQILALIDEGLRVGYMQLHSPETVKPAGFPPELFELQLSNKLTQVSHDDLARTKLLIVYGGAVGMFLDETKSNLRAERSVLVDHQLPWLQSSEYRSSVSLGQAMSYLDACFGTKFEVTGATDYDYDRLKHFVPEARLLPDGMVWQMCLNDRPAPISTPADVPKIGFHTYGNSYRWPSTLSVFERVYKSQVYRTYFYGNLKPAYKKYGEAAFNDTEVINGKQQSVDQFLENIDFWVYHPHQRLTTQPWMPVLKAMQAGKVVILPPRLENVYGDAAIYADPDGMDETVRKFSENDNAFIAQAKRGQEYISQRFTPPRVVARYQALVSKPTISSASS